MSDQVLAAPAVRSFVGLLRGHTALTRGLSARLLADHGLTLNDYEVLLHLSRAPDHRLRRVDLVERLLLTPSGITRLLDGLESAALVAKATCESDARVTYAVLTDEGYETLRRASRTHMADIDAAFAGFRADELEMLADLLGRLTDNGADEPCEPG
ncbi:MAG: MarR family transcriptional regulator [Thermoleophilia bacterium]|nr:MarR family transcriptional regulator [Thermoleophilia bacterium]